MRISTRQAESAGVRRRDLLWRDFSRLCWRLMPALRQGVPVIQAPHRAIPRRTAPHTHTR